MADFPRTVVPDRVSMLWLPTGLRERSHAGRITTRTTSQTGWMWKEKFDLLAVRNVDHVEFMAYIRYAFHRMIEFDIAHLLTPGSGKSRNGAGTPAGDVLVAGAGQLGDTLITDGWPASVTGVVRGGDLIQVNNRTLMVRAPADSDSSGVCEIPITPNLYTSPPNNAVVTIENVKLNAMIWSLPDWPENSQPDFYAGVIEFAEVLP